MFALLMAVALQAPVKADTVKAAKAAKPAAAVVVKDSTKKAPKVKKATVKADTTKKPAGK